MRKTSCGQLAVIAASQSQIVVAAWLSSESTGIRDWFFGLVFPPCLLGGSLP